MKYPIRWAAVALNLFYVLTISELNAQPFPQWGDMRPGPYPVGFQVMQLYDYSRAYWPKRNYLGIKDTLETARPMQISIWYPAGTNSSAEHLEFAQYVDLQAAALGLERATEDRIAEARAALRRGPLNPHFEHGVSDAAMAEIMTTPTAAIKDAPAADGSFPLIIHSGFSLIGQSVLMEYLASHGYVVASVPLLGTSPAWYNRGSGTAAAYQAGADDIGFIKARLRRLPFVDPNRTAGIGMFSADALLYQMQYQQLDAIAVLDGRYPAILRDIPGFDPNAIRIPILDMPHAGFRDDRSLLDALYFSHRYLIRFDGVSHSDFYQFQRIAHPENADEHVAYAVIARYTLAFLDSVLKGDESSRAFLDKAPELTGAPAGMMTIRQLPAQPAFPTEEEFLLLIRQDAVQEARDAYRRFQNIAPSGEIVREESLITTLFFLRRDLGAAASVEAFQLLTEVFPNSWRSREHLAVTLQQAELRDRARAAYEETARLLQLADLDDATRKTHLKRISARIAGL